MSKGRSYKHKVKTGDTLIFSTDLPEEEVHALPIFANQYEFIKFFRERDLELLLWGIIKPSLPSAKGTE